MADFCCRKKDTEPTEDGPVEALQIRFPTLALRRPPKLYRCERTGHIWPRSVLGCAPESTAGELREVTDDELDHDPRVGRQRRELKESRVFSMALWAEEHSAQLSPAENRRLQDLFKMGARNILSSTTTLESRAVRHLAKLRVSRCSGATRCRIVPLRTFQERGRDLLERDQFFDAEDHPPGH